jgi:hypothetical protein
LHLTQSAKRLFSYTLASLSVYRDYPSEAAHQLDWMSAVEGMTMVAAVLLVITAMLSLQISAVSTDFKQEFGTCKGGNHAVGKWVFNDKLTNTDKSFYCCGYDDNDYQSNVTLCGLHNARDRQTVVFGTRPQEFSHFEYFVGQENHLMQSGGNACVCDKAGDKGRWEMHMREKYEWTPSFCFLQAWNAKTFCELLGDRNILIRGDSTAGQSAITLINMLVAKGEKCQKQITFSWANMLGLSTGPRNHELLDMVHHANASIVIFSAGAHFHSLDQYKQGWEPMVAKIADVQTQLPHVKFAFKTINPGHVNCHEHFNPTEHYQPPAATTSDEFHWNLHPAFDNYAKEVVRTRLRIPVIDMTPLYTRPDAHADCLHLCLPGPLNLFSTLVLNMLSTGEL